MSSLTRTPVPNCPSTRLLRFARCREILGERHSMVAMNRSFPATGRPSSTQIWIFGARMSTLRLTMQTPWWWTLPRPGRPHSGDHCAGAAHPFRGNEGTAMPNTSPPCWPEDTDYLDGRSEIHVPSSGALRAFWDADVLDSNGIPPGTII